MAFVTGRGWSGSSVCMGNHASYAVGRLCGHDFWLGTAVEVIDHGSARAVKARLGRTLGGVNEKVLVALIAVLVVAGAVLVAVGISIGWLLIGLAAWPAMLVKWYRGELRAVPANAAKSGLVVTDVLDSAVLAQLPKQPTPQDFASAVMASSSGLFYAVRFGITPNFLQQIASTEQSETQQVLADAMEIRDVMDADELSAGMLVYALLKQFPEHDALLAHNHLSLNDVRQGIQWQRHLADLIDRHAKRSRTGGIARDWSFGYTPLLSRFGQNISQQISAGGLLNVELDSHHDALGQLINDTASGIDANIRHQHLGFDIFEQFVIDLFIANKQRGQAIAE